MLYCLLVIDLIVSPLICDPPNGLGAKLYALICGAGGPLYAKEVLVTGWIFPADWTVGAGPTGVTDGFHVEPPLRKKKRENTF